MLGDGQDLGECQLGSGDERARRANSECRERRGRARLEKKRESNQIVLQTAQEQIGGSGSEWPGKMWFAAKGKLGLLERRMLMGI